MAIVGGGPVGLFLAAELRRGGVSVVVYERKSRGAGGPEDGGDRGLQARTLQLLGWRGLLDRVRARAAAENGPGIADFTGAPGEQAPPEIAELVESWGTTRLKGHFAMLPLIDRDDVLADVPGQLEVWQDRLVEVLTEHAHDSGAVSRDGYEVTDVTDRGNHVHIGFSDGSTEQARWLVGCDGGSGIVRTGFAFDSTDPAMHVLMAHATLEPADLVQPGIHRTATGLMFVNPPPGEIVVVEFDRPAPDRRGPVGRAEFTDAIRRVSGADITVTAFERATRVTDYARLARNYRRGRILLAGDAAHLHSPMGGQGLNVGLQDAANLGWKLAAVVAGGDVDLLDSYERERRPAAQRVLRNTLAQSALLRTDPHSEALRAVVAELIELPQAKRHLAEMVSGTANRLPTPAGRHPLEGTFAPASVLAAIPSDAVGPVRVQPDGLPVMVVRPDGYIESVP
ncbi:FAD-dependent monooxygenase [Nocardia sp. NBC_01377]|uniref:FAD-dependent monooxygenase n=1 Tax=Nocardia sp. NBC_01377 TaxID=2903595 RepID=UPI003864491B